MSAAVGANSTGRIQYKRFFNDLGSYFNMESSKTPVLAVLACCMALAIPLSASAREVDSSIAACLKAWGTHPFGENPQYKTLGTSLTVFGIGGQPDDTQPTSSPSLVLIEPSFNVMGKSAIELLNPNGWYCMRTTVAVLGVETIRAHCRARLAAASAGSTAQANNMGSRSFRDLAVTFIGSVDVERPCN